MQEKEIHELIEKYHQGKCTDQEVAFLESWYNGWNKDLPLGLSDLELGADLLAIQQQVAPGQQKVRKLGLWIKIGAAAAVTVIALGVYFFNARHLPVQDRGTMSQAKHDIAPGRNGATLTFAGGSVIPLSGAKTGVVIGRLGKLAYNDGSEIASDAAQPLHEVQNLTARTARGQTYQFTLPDGTKVWLNADSKISFPSQFSGKERKILLSGEAYFVVAHNAEQPFKVESDGQVVEDIGTEFNINAYADESSTKTTLLEGSAHVNAIILSPDQQSVLKAGKLRVENVNAMAAIDWKQGKFMFKNEPLTSILRKVSRWYNVDIDYQTNAYDETTFSGIVSRFDHVSTVLEMLHKTGNVNFAVEGRKIKVK